MGSDYRPVRRDLGVVMSPIQSEKKILKRELVYRFTWFDITVVLISMGTYIADIVTDILVTLVYWKLDEEIWAGLTLGFLIVPSIIMQIFSTRWYMADGHRITLWMIFTHLFMMGPILRYIAVLKFGFRARRTKRIEDYQAMYSQLSDVSMLRLFESFLESAPQLVLQLYIMIKVTEGDHILTGIAAFFSLISLSWAIAAYTKALRTAAFSQDSRKKRVSWSGLALQTLWRVGMVAGRIIALVLFATVYPVWLIVGVGVHWFVMTVWLVAQDTDFCGTWWEEKLFNAVVGVIHIFCFFNMKEGKSRWRMVAFYIITLAENSAMILLWFPHRTIGMWYNIPALVTVWGGFLVGIVSMFFYYRFFHPSSPKKCHCCMFYYHVLYRCCPCDNSTSFRGTPYRRNVAIPESVSDSQSDESDCDKYRPVSGIYEQNDDPHGKSLLKRDFPLGEEPGDKVRLTKIKPLDSPVRNGKKVLLMPRPKMTSTPGDDLDDVIMRQPWKQNHGEIDLDDISSSMSNSRSNLKDMGRDEFFSEQKKTLIKNDIEPLTSTPSLLKNLPGAATGPCTNKGNSTLVREWVKKTQDIYNPKGDVKRGVSFNITEEEPTGPDFGTLGSTVRHATEEEREFMAKHFGKVGEEGPSGRRDILRMKSFSKKERQRAPVKKRAKKRRRSSYNLVDLRNSFREAFGFHSIDVDEVRHQVNEPSHKLHDDKNRGRRRERGRERTTDRGWAEIDIDCDHQNDLEKQTSDDQVDLGDRTNDLGNERQGQRMNLILARIDQPPEHGILKACISDNRAKLDLGIGRDKAPNWSKKNEAGILDSQCVVMQPVAVMENLHGTAAPSNPQIHPDPIIIPTAPVITVSDCPDTDEECIPRSTEHHPTVTMAGKKQAKPTARFEVGRPGSTPFPVLHTDNSGSEKNVTQPEYQSSEEKSMVTQMEVEGDLKIPQLEPLPNIRKHAKIKIQGNSGEPTSVENVAQPVYEHGPIENALDSGSEPHKPGDIKAKGASKFLWKRPVVEKHKMDEAATPGDGCDLERADLTLYKTCGSNVFSAEKSVYDNMNETKQGEISCPQDGDEEQIVGYNPQRLSEDAKKAIQKPAKKDMFGPVIRVTGGAVTVTHRDDAKSALISNPAIEKDVESALISNPEKKENDQKPAANHARRDRIEYLYKMGRHGLKLAAENSPARKRLSFKKDNIEYCIWSSEDENDEKCVFHTENETQKFAKNEKIKPKNRPQTFGTSKEMEKSIEALGASMEGVINEGENYKIHIRDTEAAKSQNGRKSRKSSSKKSSKSLDVQKNFLVSKQLGGKRRTLGSIENK